MSAKCDGVSVRLSPRTSAVRKAVLPAGAQVYAVTKVSGGSWRASCAGTSVSGSTWYRISIIGGTRVSSRFGVSYVYAATGLFRKTTPYPKYTTCDGVALGPNPPRLQHERRASEEREGLGRRSRDGWHLDDHMQRQGAGWAAPVADHDRSGRACLQSLQGHVCLRGPAHVPRCGAESNAPAGCDADAEAGCDADAEAGCHADPHARPRRAPRRRSPSHP